MANQILTFEEGRVQGRKRGKYWGVRYRLDDGKRVAESLKVTNKDIAKKKAAAINDLLETGQIQTKAAMIEHKGRTFRDLSLMFLETYSWSERTKKSMRSLVGKVTDHFGDSPIAAITTLQINEYLAARIRTDGLKATSSRNRYRSVMSSMFKHAIDQGWVAKSPVDAVPMVKEDKKEPHPYNEVELDRLLTSLPDRQRDVAIVAVDTGMRKGELQRLQWDHVSFHDGGELKVIGTKNKKDRTIPMTSRVNGILSALRQDLPKSKVVSLYVWGPSADLIKHIHRAAKQTEIPNANQRRLRDTFGTRCFDKGIPLQEVMQLMGHETPAMTMRYASVSSYRLRDAIRKLEA